MPKWYSITVERKMELISTGEIDKSIGYHYKTKDGIEMVEFHVDSHATFQNEYNNLPFGGNILVRKPIHKKSNIFWTRQMYLLSVYFQ